MERFVLSLLTSSFAMTAVAFVYMLLSKILRERWSAKWRYYTWILIFIGFIMPYKPSFGSAAVSFNTKQGIVEIGNMGNYPLPDSSLDIFQMMFIVWAAGTTVFMAKALLDQYMFVRSVKRLSRPVGNKTKKLIDSLTDELLIWQRVKAVRLSQVSTPMIVGFFSPTIILPRTEFSEEELRLILKHELIHFKNKDLFLKAFMLSVHAINWFNPFLKLFLRNAEQECEMYCDEKVMAGESEYSKRIYCQSILNSVSNSAEKNLRLKPVLSSNFNMSGESLKQRLKTIISVKKRYRLGIISGVMAALTVLSGTIFAFSDESRYNEGEGPIAYTSTTDVSFTSSSDTAPPLDDYAAVTTTFIHEI